MDASTSRMDASITEHAPEGHIHFPRGVALTPPLTPPCVRVFPHPPTPQCLRTATPSFQPSKPPCLPTSWPSLACSTSPQHSHSAAPTVDPRSSRQMQKPHPPSAPSHISKTKPARSAKATTIVRFLAVDAHADNVLRGRAHARDRPTVDNQSTCAPPLAASGSPAAPHRTGTTPSVARATPQPSPAQRHAQRPPPADPRVQACLDAVGIDTAHISIPYTTILELMAMLRGLVGNSGWEIIDTGYRPT